MRNLTTSELDLSLFRFVKGKHFFRDTNMDARLHCVDLDTAYNQVQTKPPSRLFTIFKPDYLCQCNVSLKWPGGQKAGESLDVDPRVAELVERRRHSLPRPPRGAAPQHGRGAAGDRDVLRVPARGDQANLRLSSHQLGLAVQHDWQVTLKFLASWKKTLLSDNSAPNSTHWARCCQRWVNCREDKECWLKITNLAGADAPHHVHHLLHHCQQVRVPQHGLPPHRQAHSSCESDNLTIWTISLSN